MNRSLDDESNESSIGCRYPIDLAVSVQYSNFLQLSQPFDSGFVGRFGFVLKWIASHLLVSNYLHKTDEYQPNRYFRNNLSTVHRVIRRIKWKRRMWLRMMRHFSLLSAYYNNIRIQASGNGHNTNMCTIQVQETRHFPFEQIFHSVSIALSNRIIWLIWRRPITGRMIWPMSMIFMIIGKTFVVTSQSVKWPLELEIDIEWTDSVACMLLATMRR